MTWLTFFIWKCYKIYTCTTIYFNILLNITKNQYWKTHWLSCVFIQFREEFHCVATTKMWCLSVKHNEMSTETLCYYYSSTYLPSFSVKLFLVNWLPIMYTGTKRGKNTLKHLSWNDLSLAHIQNYVWHP